MDLDPADRGWEAHTGLEWEDLMDLEWVALITDRWVVAPGDRLRRREEEAAGAA